MQLCYYSKWYFHGEMLSDFYPLDSQSKTLVDTSFLPFDSLDRMLKRDHSLESC